MDQRDLTCVCLELAANMLHMAGRGIWNSAGKIAQGAMEDGSALKCLKSMVESQGRDGRYVENPGLFHKAPLSREVKASEDRLYHPYGYRGNRVASVMLGQAGIKRRIPLITAQASFWRKNMETVWRGRGHSSPLRLS